MPYSSIDQLPASVRSHLPVEAQEIFVAAFNNAHEEFEGKDEVRAFKIAWGAVKRKYEKRDGRWVLKQRKQAS